MHFWAAIERAAARVRDTPRWMRQGLLVDPRHFETYHHEEQSPCPATAQPTPSTLPPTTSPRD